jgi:hypothetical protein
LELEREKKDFKKEFLKDFEAAKKMLSTLFWREKSGKVAG